MVDSDISDGASTPSARADLVIPPTANRTVPGATDGWTGAAQI